MNWIKRIAGFRPKKPIRILIVAIAIAAMPIVALATGDRKQIGKRSKADAPKYIAVRFHADWCATCNQLVPQYDKLLAATKDVPVLFVTLDMTSDVTRRQGEYLASTLGIDRVWAEQQNRVGVIKLIDAQDKRVVDTISIGSGHEKIEAAIRKAASAKPAA